MRTRWMAHLSLLTVFSLLLAPGCGNTSSKSGNKSNNPVTFLPENVGDHFEIGSLLDLSGQPVQPDFTGAPLTLVDFWFSECRPCIEDMKQFQQVLPAKQGKIRVVSISLNSYKLWKTILSEPHGRFAFLADRVQNWEHYDLKSGEDARLGNDVPSDNVDQLIKRYKVKFYPAYFVVGSDGKIKSRPVSAVDFINDL